MPEFTPADQETLDIAHRIIDEYHPWLLDANIVVVFRDGEPPKSGGKITLGAASLVDARMRVVAKEEYDFFIWLSYDWWESAPEEKRRALVDHELCHCSGQPGGWKMRGHDIEEFVWICPVCRKTLFGDAEGRD